MLDSQRGTARQIQRLRRNRPHLHPRPRTRHFRCRRFSSGQVVPVAPSRRGLSRSRMRYRRSDFATLDRARLQRLRSGRLAQHHRCIPRAFPDQPRRVGRCRRFQLLRPNLRRCDLLGLFFLLTEEVQRKLIAKVAAVLPSGGRFLFTSPSQICAWSDAMTERTSISLRLRSLSKRPGRRRLLANRHPRRRMRNFYDSAQKR
jgi:hypothetical protein